MTADNPEQTSINDTTTVLPSEPISEEDALFTISPSDVSIKPSGNVLRTIYSDSIDTIDEDSFLHPEGSVEPKYAPVNIPHSDATDDDDSPEPNVVQFVSNTFDSEIHYNTISFGDAKSYPLSTSNPDWNFYSIYIPYTIHPSNPKTIYQNAEIKFRINEKCTATALCPEVVETRLVNEKFGLTAGFTFEPFEASASYEKDYSFSLIVPKLQAGGEGESEFYWKYYANPQIHEGRCNAIFILRTPTTFKRIYLQVGAILDYIVGWYGYEDDFDIQNRFKIPLSQDHETFAKPF